MTSVHEISIREALFAGSQRLEDSESPWLDACLLLGQTLGWRREKLLASYPDLLDKNLYTDFMCLIEKRSLGYPIAYITKNKEFYGRDFYVKEGILCPRPDTEILIEEALHQIIKHNYKRVHDLCTGSGCIALTLSLENLNLLVSASDISKISEEVFRTNRKSLHAESVSFKLTSLFDDIEGPIDLIATNPPYLTTKETDDRMDQKWREPALALDGGRDGLDLIRIIIEQAPSLLSSRGMLMIEADPRQMDCMETLFIQNGFNSVKRVCDLAGDERVISGQLNTGKKA